MYVRDVRIQERVLEIQSHIKTFFPHADVVRFSFQSLVISFPRGQCRLLLCVPKDRDLSKTYCEPSLVLQNDVLTGSSFLPLFFSSWIETFQGIYRFYFRFVCLYILTHFPRRLYALQPYCPQKVPSLFTLIKYTLSTQELTCLKHFELPIHRHGDAT